MREVRCANPECGALNRVPTYSFRRIPQCGKCTKSLPETKGIRAARHIYKFRAAAIVVLIGGGLLAWGLSGPSAVVPEPKQTVVCPPNALPRQGVYRWYSAVDDVASFTIKTADGSNYFVKLEDAAIGTPVISFFVRGGSTLTSKVPLGTFTLKYASGTSWCNETDLFGADTATNEANDTFKFDQQSGYTPTGWTVELIRQPGGNLRTHAIPRSKF